MKSLIVSSNMFNEINEIDDWLCNMRLIATEGILVVDSGSTDGTIEFLCKQSDVVVIIDDIIQREGYGPARNHLREMSKKHFPEAEWMVYFDADERINPEDVHMFRFLCEYVSDPYNVIALPRIDWYDRQMTKAAKDWRAFPDFQARMSRLSANVNYVRRLHEQVDLIGRIYVEKSSPKINHFHRTTSQEKRDFVGKLCAHLHREDTEFGNTYPEHHKEDYYREMLDREGL